MYLMRSADSQLIPWIWVYFLFPPLPFLFFFRQQSLINESSHHFSCDFYFIFFFDFVLQSIKTNINRFGVSF